MVALDTTAVLSTSSASPAAAVDRLGSVGVQQKVAMDLLGSPGV